MANGTSPEEFARALNESARLLMQNRPGEAVDKLLPLYAQAPEHPDVLINLSGAYVLQRKWNKAVALLNKAVQVHPNNVMLWTNLGAAQLGRLEVAGPRQQERAIAAYQQALKVDPEAPNVHYHLGLIYKERGELNRASAFFQRALEVNPTDHDARYWLDRLTSLMLEAQQRPETARSQGDMAAVEADSLDADSDPDSDPDSNPDDVADIDPDNGERA